MGYLGGDTEEIIAKHTFPWGEVLRRMYVAGREVVEHRQKDDNRIMWFVATSESGNTGHSFPSEGLAAIFAGLLAERVSIDTASRLTYGLTGGFREL